MSNITEKEIDDWLESLWDRPYNLIRRFLGEELSNKRTEQRKLEEKFWGLATKWYNDGRNNTNMRDKIYHDSFLHLVAMGEKIIPILLRELSDNTKYWTPVLKAIAPTVDNDFTDPILPEHYGDRDLIIKDWLIWGEKFNFYPAK